MDENGDAEGNYTLIARKMSKNKENEYGLFPAGVFSLLRTDSRLPVSSTNLCNGILFPVYYRKVFVVVMWFKRQFYFTRKIILLYN